MNIFLTGGSGFIGRNILESFLARKYNIIAPTHGQIDLLDEDKVMNFFLNNKIDVVIHTAVKPGHRNAKDPSNQLYNNLRMFFNIIRNREAFGKMIFISSGAVYDVSKPMVKVKEENFDTYVPVDEHGFSKYIIAKHIERLDNVVELRIFGIFGKYEDYAIRFISNAICKAIFDLPITIKQNRRFAYLLINDLMTVADYFIENKGSHKAYNVTSDKAIELLSIAEKVREISGKDLPIIVKEQGMGLEYSGDDNRLKKEIKDLRLTNIDIAIKELYEWYVNNKHLINKDLLLTDN